MRQFDALVCEILGTVSTSESMFEYCSRARPYLRRFEESQRVYVVPERTVVETAFYNLDLDAGIAGGGQNYALRTALAATLPCYQDGGPVGGAAPGQPPTPKKAWRIPLSPTNAVNLGAWRRRLPPRSCLSPPHPPPSAAIHEMNPVMVSNRVVLLTETYDGEGQGLNFRQVRSPVEHVTLQVRVHY